MYSATILVSIQEFVPMTGIYGESPSIVAKLAPPNDISPPPYPETPVFSGDGEKITVTVPANYQGSVQLIYQLPDPRYVMLGAAFKSEKDTVGRMQFRNVLLNRDPYGSQMVITDACVEGSNSITYSYVIIVQEVSTANIGLIDPEIENENGE